MVLVPAWKVPTTVEEACDTKPLGRVRRLVTVNDPAVSVPIVAVLALRLVEVAPALKVARPPKYDARVVVAPPKMVRPVVCVPLPIVVEARMRLLPLKMLLPLKVLLFERSVDEAAVTVMEPPTLSDEPLMVPRVPVRRLVPMDEVETTFPVASVPRSDEVRLVR